MTPEERAAIRARLDAATPGPWSYGDIDSVAGGTLYDTTVAIGSMRWDNDNPMPIHRKVPASEADANGEFIAHARTDVERLLDALDEATPPTPGPDTERSPTGLVARVMGAMRESNREWNEQDDPRDPVALEARAAALAVATWLDECVHDGYRRAAKRIRREVEGSGTDD